MATIIDCLRAYPRAALLVSAIFIFAPMAWMFTSSSVERDFACFTVSKGAYWTIMISMITGVSMATIAILHP